MRLKSYFSGTVEAAMALARREMGDDAMLVHSRPSQPEARHLGAYEVVFGTYGEASGGLRESARRRRAAPESGRDHNRWRQERNCPRKQKRSCQQQARRMRLLSR